MIPSWTACVRTSLVAAAIGTAVPTVASAQRAESVVRGAPTKAKEAITEASPTGGKSRVDGDTSLQTSPPAESATRTPVEAEIQSRFNELRRELLDNRGDTIDWWLAVVAIVLTFFGIVVAIAGFLGFSRFREIEREAKASAETATKYAENARQYVEEIKENRDRSNVIFQDITARAAADDPARASQTVENVRGSPNVSLIDSAIADAIDLQRLGEIKRAVEKWRAIANIAEEKSNDLAAGAWSSIGYLIKDESPTDSILAYDRAIRLRPDLAEAYNNRGNVKYFLGQPEAAIADHDEAVRLKPDFAEAYTNRGTAKAKLERHDDAIADYDEAIRLKPDLAGAYNNRANAKAMLGRLDDAIADYDEAVRLKPSRANVYYHRGLAKRKLDLKDEARMDFETALNLASKTGDSIVDAVNQALRHLDTDEHS